MSESHKCKSEGKKGDSRKCCPRPQTWPWPDSTSAGEVRRVDPGLAASGSMSVVLTLNLDAGDSELVDEYWATGL